MTFDLTIFSQKAIVVLAKAYGWTLIITLVALTIGIILGTLLAVGLVIPQNNIFQKIIRMISTSYLAVIRGTPATVQLMICYFVIFSKVLFFNNSIHPYIVAMIGFGLNSAAYVAEIMRAGINSVDKGQMEAGRSLGLSYGSTMRFIILPQSVKNILPSLGNEAIALVKDTSIALVIGASEFFSEIQGLAVSQYNVLTPFLAAAVVYFLTVLIIAALVKKLEKRLSKNERRR